jgi:daunorubicin C-13 ketoreductase
MARRGAHVVLVGRDRDRLAAAETQVRKVADGRPPVAFRADFARLEEVHTLVDQIRQRYGKIDVLASNAGGLVPRRLVTPDGFEATIQTNHLAPFLLANLLREQLRGGRIISTSSGAHEMGRIDPANLTGTGRYARWRAYGAAKQANILFTQEAARRWPDIVSVCFHPGFVRTRFAAGTILAPLIRIAPMLRSPEQGADTLVWLASVPPSRLTSGGYYVNRTLVQPAATATDPTLAAWLWDASTAAVIT